ncbi:HetP family heterocyst commitment protein [Anabaena sp. UHCC 0204]|uniref:HetP family heterocyst commitment protein n=1 Tax=Anabaena sp. UHCC 0204 TaxID=2590009 RepID=UPI00144718CF|nr:HetP family heterocyst commitment protein [Anabaena sp. UHCC 0204]MTJ08991.1 heterocyst formation protein HetP [Anabaena sp. UHCC 0204]
MSQNLTGYSASINKKIKAEQIEQIIKAIISGKYSWACVLVLQFSGYNPIDYIPYRTYIRLLKTNCLLGNAQENQPNVKKVDRFDVKSKWVRF